MTAALLSALLAAVDAGSAVDAGAADAGVFDPPVARVRLQPGMAKPGDAVLVTVYGSTVTPTGSVGSWPLKFVTFRGGHQALIGLPTEMKLGALKVAVSFPIAGKKQDYALSLDVVDPQFRHDELKVDKKFVAPSKEQKKWMADDQREFNAAFAQPLVPRLFEEAFAWPRLDRLAAPFGDLRLFNGKKQSQHFGADIDGEIGDEAHAANDGVVVMVRECFGSGNTVILHHGMGLYTAYFHLSKFEVKKGDAVHQGDLLGLIGKTGRVTGPHLHWGVKIDGRWVDPQSLLRLDFE